MSTLQERITVHIERLVLDGIPIGKAQAPALQAAIEAELVRLLAVHGIADEFRSGAALASIRTGTITLSGENKPGGLGRKIARAVHAGIGNVQASAGHEESNEPVVATVPRGAR
jgi:hypothetical protein